MMKKLIGLILMVFIVSPVFKAQSAKPDEKISANIETLKLTSKVFNNTRNIRVLLPPNYHDAKNRNRRYPVLYLNDGIMVFHAYNLEETVHRLIKTGLLPPLIIVGIDNGGSTDKTKNAETDRANEFLPYPDVGFAPNRLYEPDPQSPIGKLYPQFIAEVMAFIKQRYRIKFGAENTGIGGASYGGVAALYTAIRKPDVFGKLLLESPPLWIGRDKQLLKDTEEVKTWTKKIYLGLGTKESDDEVINQEGLKERDQLIDVIRKRSPRTMIKLVLEEGAKHQPFAWSKRFPAALQFLFNEKSSIDSAKSKIETQQKLKDYVERVAANGFSGQVLVADKGKILFDQAVGLAHREKRIPNTLKTVFNVASLTKQFTAAAILRLETDGKLKTSDTISKYLENVPTDKSAITIHQLLTHTSGLSRGDGGRKNTTRDETVARILKQPLIAKVGEKSRYSNNGYHLLAAIIEMVSGNTYPQYLRENLFKPAGMNETGFYQDEIWSKFPVAETYNEWTKLPGFTEWNKVWNYGSGSVVSTSNDLLKWLTALQENKILPTDEKEKLFTKYEESLADGVYYGYGWFLEKQPNEKWLVFHGGDNPGYHSEFRWYQNDDRVIIILTNYELLEPDGVAINKRVIANNLNRILSGEEYKQPPSFIKLTAQELKKYEGEYSLPNGEKLKIWRNGDYLEIGAEGQEAINAIAGYDGEIARKYAAANELTKFILDNISKGNAEIIKTRVPKEDYDFYIPFLIKQYKEFSDKFGSLKEIKIQGTTSFPWDPNSSRTNVILRFEKGSTDLFLGFENGKINDVTTETGRPFPLMMPFVPNSKTEFSTFEFLRSKQTSFRFEIKKKVIEIQINASKDNIKGTKRV